MRITGDLKLRMTEMLGDPDAQRILSSVSRVSKPASVIEAELSLTPSTAYRKIAELRECGLLMIDHFLEKPDGKREATYACTFREIKFTTNEAGGVADGEIELEVKLSRRAEEKRWFDWFFSSKAKSS